MQLGSETWAACLRVAPPAIIFPMTPLELFQSARLAEAILMQEQIIAARGDDPVERLLLCDFLAYAGENKVVRLQLEQLVNAPEVLQSYLGEWRKLLAADDARHCGVQPDFLFEPAAHIRNRLQARMQLAGGLIEEAVDSLDAADESAAWVAGHVDGREFDGWRDSDDLLGPVLEVLHSDRYVWVPVEQVLKLRLEDADSLRDQLYRPATLWLVDGSRWEVFMPALYVGSAEHPEEGIRTGAGVDWIELHGVMRGVGERTFLFGEEELGISEFKQVEIRRR
ncbi:MAG: hypothetical protein EXS09_16180 [Gemmataceae bacterium]|nr:hypothetical protein [Gemmataceae bacterium]